MCLNIMHFSANVLKHICTKICTYVPKYECTKIHMYKNAIVAIYKYDKTQAP